MVFVRLLGILKLAIVMSLGGKKSVSLPLKTLTNDITGVVKVES